MAANVRKTVSCAALIGNGSISIAQSGPTANRTRSQVIGEAAEAKPEDG